MTICAIGARGSLPGSNSVPRLKPPPPCASAGSPTVARDLMLYSRQDIGSLPADLNLVDRLSVEKLDGLSEALAWQIDDAEGREPDEAALIGHALGGRERTCLCDLWSRQARLDWPFRRVDLRPTLGGFCRFRQLEALGRNPDALEAFVDFIAAIVTRANDAPDTVTEIPPRRASMASIVEQFARAGSFQEVWEVDQWPILFRSGDAFEILRRADAKRFVRMIDQLPHPTLVRQCLSSKVLLASPHDTLILLRLANTAFDTDGRWQRSGMAAISVAAIRERTTAIGARRGGGDRRPEQRHCTVLQHCVWGPRHPFCAS